MTLQPPSTSPPSQADADLEQVRKELIASLADAELMARVHRAVEACARVPRDSLIARELVADVVDDTYRGERRWDLKVGFMTHVLDEARRQLGRTSRRRRNHVPLHELREDVPALPHAADEPERERSIAVLRERVARARDLLGSDGDPATLQLLTFYELGVTRRRDVQRLGLSGWRYRAAYDRLSEVFASLDAMPETEQGMEQPVFHPVRSAGEVTALTSGHRIGPKRADIRTGRSSAGAQGSRIVASHRRSRKRPAE